MWKLQEHPSKTGRGGKMKDNGKDFKEMRKNDEWEDEKDGSAKGMKDRKGHMRNENMKEIIFNETSNRHFEYQLPYWQSVTPSLALVSCYNNCMVSSVLSRSFLAAASINHFYCIVSVNKAKTIAPWSIIGHWHKPWCEKNIITVIVLLLTHPRMYIHNTCNWVIQWNLVMTTFRLLCTVVINKIYQCATCGSKLRMQFNIVRDVHHITNV